MPPRYCYDYPRPAVTVDLVVFALADDALRVALIKRKDDPFAGRWAIPGGFINIDEPIEHAARRELREETGLSLRGPCELIGVYGKPGRDPRGRTISLAHAAVVRPPLKRLAGADDASEAAWANPLEIKGLAFDHDAILLSALSWLARGVAAGPAGLGLLPREFNDNHVRSLHRALAGSVRSAAAWRKSLLRQGQIIVVDEAEPRYRGV